MNLYLVHCGYYDPEIFDGVFESHANLLIAAADPEEAKLKASEAPDFRKHKMHIDGMREIHLLPQTRNGVNHVESQ